MRAKALAAASEHGFERLHLRVAWLCGVVLFLEGYDIAAVGYAIPSLVDAWRVAPSVFTQALTAGNAKACGDARLNNCLFTWNSEKA